MENNTTGKKNYRYIELKNKIEETYKDSPPLSLLPSERELCEMYSVSRPTVRKALNMLEEENSIVRIQGKGTFFNRNQEHRLEMENVTPFYHQVSLSGDYTGSKVLMQNIEKADAEVAEHLQIKVGAQVFRLERVRYVGDLSMSLSTDYIPYEMCTELLQVDFTKTTLFKTMEKYGLIPYCGHKIVKTEKANVYTALHLGVEEGEPITEANTVTVDKNNKIVVYNITRSLAYQTTFEIYVFSQQEAWPKYNHGSVKLD